MLDHPLQDLESWVLYFSGVELPILRLTARRLEEARLNIDAISGRDIAQIVLNDPLMAVRVLAYIQPFRGRHLRSDITTIAGAVMMLGVEPFFEKFDHPLTIEAMLEEESQALIGVLQLVRRVQRAARYAHDWAFARHDINVEEVTLAALLHDLSEILLWCFAPRLAMEVRTLQLHDKALRSTLAQEKILGIKLADLQFALCRAWHLPDLLKLLMDDAHADQPRVRNVTLAVNLARHSANGWSDAALPDDFAAIEKLLHISHETLIARLRLPPEALPQPAAPADDGAPAAAPQ
jgi:HD-like signal output (HDOD) protein